MNGFAAQLVKRFLILWFPFCMTVPVFAQEEEPPASATQTPAGAAQAQAEAAQAAQNAIIEGIQISSEPSKLPGENVVTCYFIFKDKPSSYFYEVKKKNKKITFEFNDTQRGSSPLSSVQQPPIDSFVLEQKKIDVNKEVKGLNPEWHDLITVTFCLSAVPNISVSDEANVISFSYKWTSDPTKIAQYTVKEDKNYAGWFWGIGGALLVGGGIGAYIATRPPPPQTVPDLSITDLPNHTN